jgi:hypothetical protein
MQYLQDTPDGYEDLASTRQDDLLFLLTTPHLKKPLHAFSRVCNELSTPVHSRPDRRLGQYIPVENGR